LAAVRVLQTVSIADTHELWFRHEWDWRVMRIVSSRDAGWNRLRRT
jgi:hypothetical protein